MKRSRNSPFTGIMNLLFRSIDLLVPQPSAIYVMDKAYIDFLALFNMHRLGAYFISRAKTTLDFDVVENKFKIDNETGLRGDKIITYNVWNGYVDGTHSRFPCYSSGQKRKEGIYNWLKE